MSYDVKKSSLHTQKLLVQRMHCESTCELRCDRSTEGVELKLSLQRWRHSEQPLACAKLLE